MRMHDLAHKHSRRRFVRNAAGASAALNLPAALSFAAQPRTAQVRVFTTSDTRRHAEAERLRWSTDRASAAANVTVVTLSAGQRYQPMLGFGAACTDASCYLLSTLDALNRRAFLHETYSPDAMGLNVARSTIGASDYSRSLYSYDDTPDDLSLAHFSIAHDEAYILPALRDIRAENPELFLLSSPWSPPGWMKTYGSMLGGWMTFEYLAPYARYIAKFLDAYKAAGVEVNAVTAQNELETDQGGSMPATYWTPEVESDFIRDQLGPLLRKTHKDTQIWLLDHNYELWKRVRWQMRDPKLRPFVDGVAWHGYLGTPDQMSLLHAAEPQLPFFWTEGGPDFDNPKYATEWTRWGAIFTDAINNWCRCLITWNLLLDEKGSPNIGPFHCGGLVTLRGGRELEYSGQYWALRHFSQHVRRGALRIETTCETPGLSHVAFENPDGGRVLVVINPGPARAMELRQERVSVLCTLESNSITTLLC